MKRFRTMLTRSPRLGWTIAPIPFSVADLWGTRKSLRVRGILNEHEFRGTLMPGSDGQHFLLLNRALQKTAAVTVGDTVTLSLEPDTTAPRTPEPPQLTRLLKQDRAVRRWFDALRPSVRKWFYDVVAQPRSPEARTRRAEHIFEQVLSTIDAEHELPPLIRAALDRTPNARRAWNALTEAQRRSNLLAIFYYRNPATRAKRLDRAISDALTAYEKKTRISNE